MLTLLQSEGYFAIRNVADSLNLYATELPSRNGTQFDNHLSRTIFTVYHRRLDPNNTSCLEVAVSPLNIAAELSIKSELTENWFADLSLSLPPATSKSPEFWRRIALSCTKHIRIFCDEIQRVYKIDNFQDRKENRDNVVEQRKLTRRGQPEFRLLLLDVYSTTCAISGCHDAQALEAAHIIPHAENEDYSVSNGILLRADLHRLFDQHLISIDPRSGTIAVSSKLGPMYSIHNDKLALFPHNLDFLPSPSSLMQHFLAWSAAESSKPP